MDYTLIFLFFVYFLSYIYLTLLVGLVDVSVLQLNSGRLLNLGKPTELRFQLIPHGAINGGGRI